MGIVCLAGIFAVFLLLAWTLCRAAGWEKEREDLEQEQYLKEWREKKLKKVEKAAYISRIDRLSEENEQLKKECELLRGRLFLLMNKMDR